MKQIHPMSKPRMLVLAIVGIFLCSSDIGNKISNIKYGINSYSTDMRVKRDTSKHDSNYLILRHILFVHELPWRIPTLSKEELNSLVECLNDTTKDFAACLFLYHHTQENAESFFPKPSSIEEWRIKYKEEELLFWNQKIKGY